MSNSLDYDVSLSMADATRAWQLFVSTLTIYQANCQRFDFKSAEFERITLHDALDCHLDNYMAALRRLEIAGG
jgi:hypothetical protein